MALTMQDLEKQIAELRKQNQALTAQAKKNDRFEIEVGEYNGAPTLGFSGSFKPWRKGAGSIAALFRNQEKVVAALKECGIVLDNAA